MGRAGHKVIAKGRRRVLWGPMRALRPALSLLSPALLVACASSAPTPAATVPSADAATTAPATTAHGGPHGAPVDDRLVTRPDERHLKNVKQLTFGGENAEAYFDSTGTELIMQSKRDGAACDAIYRMKADGSELKQVSPLMSAGGGRTTCSFIMPSGDVIYASTHGHQAGCLDEPDRSQGYVWKVYP